MDGLADFCLSEGDHAAELTALNDKREVLVIPMTADVLRTIEAWPWQSLAITAENRPLQTKMLCLWSSAAAIQHSSERKKRYLVNRTSQLSSGF